MIIREWGTSRAVKIFDAQAMLADLESAEATIHEDSVIVTGGADDLLQDLYDAFVCLN
jgi:histidinol-phosphate/aromatic aminotransferase/cobyric acid decarboxylase-like protein